MNKGKKKSNKIVWLPEIEWLLCDLWAERYSKIHSERQNRHLYMEMVDELKKCNFECSFVEIKAKLHNLCSKYRSEKAKIEAGEVPHSDWLLFHKIQEVLEDSQQNIIQNHKENNSDHSMVFEEPDVDESSVPWEHSQATNGHFNATTPLNGILPDVVFESPSEPAEKRRKVEIDDDCFLELRESLKISENMCTKIYEEEIKQTQLLEKKTKLLEQFVKDNSELKNAFIKFLKK